MTFDEWWGKPSLPFEAHRDAALVAWERATAVERERAAEVCESMAKNLRLAASEAGRKWGEELEGRAGELGMAAFLIRGIKSSYPQITPHGSETVESGSDVKS